MNYRELLELAAKAAGVNGQWSDYHNGICYSKKGSLDMHVWRPLDDDGDALRLAVKLRLDVSINGDIQAAWWHGDSLEFVTESLGDDLCAATRRAIVRAAASIGEQMK